MTLNDIQRCFDKAQYGITIGDATKNACLDHLADIIDSLTGSAKPAMVYPLQTNRRCDFRYAEKVTRVTVPLDTV